MSRPHIYLLHVETTVSISFQLKPPRSSLQLKPPHPLTPCFEQRARSVRLLPSPSPGIGHHPPRMARWLQHLEHPRQRRVLSSGHVYGRKGRGSGENKNNKGNEKAGCVAKSNGPFQEACAFCLGSRRGFFCFLARKRGGSACQPIN